MHFFFLFWFLCLLRYKISHKFKKPGTLYSIALYKLYFIRHPLNLKMILTSLFLHWNMKSILSHIFITYSYLNFSQYFFYLQEESKKILFFVNSIWRLNNLPEINLANNNNFFFFILNILLQFGTNIYCCCCLHTV